MREWTSFLRAKLLRFRNITTSTASSTRWPQCTCTVQHKLGVKISSMSTQGGKKHVPVPPAQPIVTRIYIKQLLATTDFYSPIPPHCPQWATVPLPPVGVVVPEEVVVDEEVVVGELGLLGVLLSNPKNASTSPARSGTVCPTPVAL